MGSHCKKNQVLFVRTTRRRRAAIVAAAEVAGMSLSGYLVYLHLALKGDPDQCLQCQQPKGPGLFCGGCGCETGGPG